MNKNLKRHEVKAVQLIIILILPFYLILSVSFLTMGQDWGGDFAAYLMQAESIKDRTVQQYIEENTFTIKNSLPGLGPILYPWGYPILLLPAICLMGINLWAIKAINILFYLFFLICIYFLFVNRMGKFKIIVILSLFAFSPVLLEAHDFIFSDIPFLFFSTLSILLMDIFVISGRRLFSKKIDYLLLGVSIFIAFSIRQNGALLLLVLILCQIIQAFSCIHNKQFKFNRFIPDILFSSTLLILLAAYEQIFVNDSTHLVFILENIFEMPIPIIKKLHYYLLLLPTFITNLFFEVYINQIIVIVLFPFMIAGLFHRWKSDYHFIFYSGFTLGLYLLFPSLNYRYIIPILPFYVYFVLVGTGQLRSFLERIHLPNLKILGNALIIIVVIFELATSYALAAENLRNNREMPGPFDPVSAEMFQFVSNNTEPESIFAFNKPRVFRFFTGRNSFRATRCKNLLLADYLLVRKDKDEYWDSEKRLEKCRPGIKFKPFFENQNFLIYSLNHQ